MYQLLWTAHQPDLISHQTRRQDETFWQSSSAQISLIAHQIKCFLRFRLCTCCCQLHPCDRRGHGHVCCGLNGSKPALCWPLSSDFVDSCDSSTCCQKDAEEAVQTDRDLCLTEALTLTLSYEEILFTPKHLWHYSTASVQKWSIKPSTFLKYDNFQSGRFTTQCDSDWWCFGEIIMNYIKTPSTKIGVHGKYFNHFWELSNFNLQNVMQH